METVALARLHPAPPGGVPVEVTAGAVVDVTWEGVWWEGVVRKDPNGTLEVRCLDGPLTAARFERSLFVTGLVPGLLFGSHRPWQRADRLQRQGRD